MSQEDKSKKRKRKGKVFVNLNFCKGCGYCVEFCPRKVFTMSDSYCDRGYHFPEVTNDNCIACKTCEMLCPEICLYVEKV